jgi:hypothetical protein
MPKTTDAERLRARLAKNRDKLAAANDRLAELEAERTGLYRSCREVIDGRPVLTFKEVADIYGVTEAAVMQKWKRANGAGSIAGSQAEPA